MRFRRKSDRDDAPVPDDVATEPGADASEAGPPTEEGPLDSGDLDSSEDRVDLGSLLLRPADGQELRIQVDDASGQVQSVVLAGADGALDLRAFQGGTPQVGAGEIGPVQETA